MQLLSAEEKKKNGEPKCPLPPGTHPGSPWPHRETYPGNYSVSPFQAEVAGLWWAHLSLSRKSSVSPLLPMWAEKEEGRKKAEIPPSLSLYLKE